MVGVVSFAQHHICYTCCYMLVFRLKTKGNDAYLNIKLSEASIRRRGNVCSVKNHTWRQVPSRLCEILGDKLDVYGRPSPQYIHILILSKIYMQITCMGFLWLGATAEGKGLKHLSSPSFLGPCADGVVHTCNLFLKVHSGTQNCVDDISFLQNGRYGYDLSI